MPRVMPIARTSRHDVEVEMRDDLPGVRAIVHAEVEGGRAGGFDDCRGKALNDVERPMNILGLRIKELGAMRARHDKRVPGIHRIDVQKCYDIIILIHAV